ncbi:hypothetical protein [Massilia sp. CCM 8734]|uniref:hypothetical protein n=1 Tax=Massilia sp. CCM 8734 TaxID=2609283 RepID=UPI0014248AE7|nr:hypothetical protein [Massilia sp. CCM 8734]NHZ95202.1 hypothetical protein [Massilia sp. CCM 8734]
MPKLHNDANVIALHRITVASPCTASWDAMQGGERVRHCGGCNKQVFNLSAMPEAEAATLVAGQAAGGLCVRFYRRADGTVMTSDCGAPSARPGPAWRALPGLATAAVLAMSLAACAPRAAAPEDMVGAVSTPDNMASGQDQATSPTFLMGEVPSPPTPQVDVAPEPDAQAVVE